MAKVIENFLVIVSVFMIIFADEYHPGTSSFRKNSRHKRSNNYNPLSNFNETTANYWNDYAQLLLQRTLNKQPITGRAKNVIIFLGDGMSIPTLAAARIYQGQSYGTSGEESHLSFEAFPYVGLSKTYCVDYQVADSACSATAYLCGVKANKDTIGVTAKVKAKDCSGMTDASNHVNSIAKWSQEAGKSTGIVTTTRVTHASPAGTYAHTAWRDWECDTEILNDKKDPKECMDIASQLIYGETGKNLDVIFGGGRSWFLPKGVIDEEGQLGKRSDGKNLISQWLINQRNLGKNATYIWNSKQIAEATKFEKILGLFEGDHLKYERYRDDNDPSLTDMTIAAIKNLRRNPNGYFLFVEGGRIDHAHHQTFGKLALEETVEFSRAVQSAVHLTDPTDTLIIVTADHAHTMSLAGYPQRGNDILGIAGISDMDKKPYSTLVYGNGEGYKKPHMSERYDISRDDMHANEYRFMAAAPLTMETHGGDDVGIFALGPFAHLLTGVHEQHLIPHIAAYASCVGPHLKFCDRDYIRAYFSKY